MKLMKNRVKKYRRKTKNNNKYWQHQYSNKRKCFSNDSTRCRNISNNSIIIDKKQKNISLPSSLLSSLSLSKNDMMRRRKIKDKKGHVYPFVCHICQKRFKTQYLKNIHKKKENHQEQKNIIKNKDIKKSDHRNVAAATAAIASDNHVMGVAATVAVNNNIDSFTCTFPNCKKTFEDEKTIANHMMMNHISNVNNNNNESELLRKEKRKMERKKFPFYVCLYPGCDTLFTTISKYRCHYVSKHKNEKGKPKIGFYCPRCESQFNRLRDLYSHYHVICVFTSENESDRIIRKNNKYFFKCLVHGCNQLFCSDAGRKRHSKRKHGVEQKIPCPRCFQKFTTLCHLEDHIYNHCHHYQLNYKKLIEKESREKIE